MNDLVQFLVPLLGPGRDTPNVRRIVAKVLFDMSSQRQEECVESIMDWILDVFGNALQEGWGLENENLDSSPFEIFVGAFEHQRDARYRNQGRALPERVNNPGGFFWSLIADRARRWRRSQQQHEQNQEQLDDWEIEQNNDDVEELLQVQQIIQNFAQQTENPIYGEMIQRILEGESTISAARIAIRNQRIPANVNTVRVGFIRAMRQFLQQNYAERLHELNIALH